MRFFHQGRHPLNLACRFLLELGMLGALGRWGWGWGWTLTGSGWRWVLALGLPVFAMLLWGTFAVPNDPSRSGKAPSHRSRRPDSLGHDQVLRAVDDRDASVQGSPVRLAVRRCAGSDARRGHGRPHGFGRCHPANSVRLVAL